MSKKPSPCPPHEFKKIKQFPYQKCRKCGYLPVP